MDNNGALSAARAYTRAGLAKAEWAAPFILNESKVVQTAFAKEGTLVLHPPLAMAAERRVDEI